MMCIKDIVCPVCGATMRCDDFRAAEVGVDGRRNYEIRYRGKLPCHHTVIVFVNEKDEVLKYVKD